MWFLPCKNGEGGGSDCEGVGEDGIVRKMLVLRWESVEAGMVLGSGQEEKRVVKVVVLEARGLIPSDLRAVLSLMVS